MARAAIEGGEEMSIHADPRQFSADPEERKDWERDLQFEYRRETYEQTHGDDNCLEISCDYQGEDGSCNCDGHCEHQTGKWKDICALWHEDEETAGD